MKDEDINFIVSHIGGFLKSAAIIDNSLLANISRVSDINNNEIKESLSNYYEKLSKMVTNEKHSYQLNNIKTIEINDLGKYLEKYIFQSPFNDRTLSVSDNVEKYRFEFIFKLIDMIRMIKDSNYNKKTYAAEIIWEKGNSIYKGHIYFFELKGDEIVLIKTVLLS